MTYTYFITSNNYVKIGRSIDPVKRLEHFQETHPQKLTLVLVIEGNYEGDLHRRFAKYRKRGEWFCFSKEIRTFVTEHPQFDPALQKARERPNMTRLKYERKNKRLSQTKLAASVGLHQGAISLIERGVLLPTPKQLERIAAIFDIPTEDLLKEVVVVNEALA